MCNPLCHMCNLNLYSTFIGESGPTYVIVLTIDSLQRVSLQWALRIRSKDISGSSRTVHKFVPVVTYRTLVI